MATTSADRAWAQHQRRAAMIEIAHLDQIRLLIRGIADRVFRADDGGEAGKQVGVWHWWRSGGSIEPDAGFSGGSSRLNAAFAVMARGLSGPSTPCTPFRP